MVDKQQRSPISELVDEGQDFEVLGQPIDGGSSLLDFYEYVMEHREEIPWRVLEKRGWIGEGRNAAALASFAPSFLEGGQRGALFRKSDDANDFLASFWLSKVEQRAIEFCVNHPKISFNAAAFNREDLVALSRMSVNVQSIRQLPELLAGFGIVLVYEKGVAGIKVDGAVTKLPNGVPVIGMSFRFNRLDNFWFTLVHELSHILLHYDALETPILTDVDSVAGSLTERQADRYAQKIFVSRRDWNRCPPKYEKSNESVIEFAKAQGIHPAIIAGMLQRETQQYAKYRKIVDEVKVLNIIEGG